MAADPGAQPQTNPGIEFLMQGRFEEAENWCSYSLSERTSPRVRAFSQAVLGWVRYFRGEWSKATVDLEQAVTISRSDPSVNVAYPSLCLGQLFIARGQWGEGSQSLEAAVAIAESRRDLQARILAQTALAERDILNGRPETACRRLAPFASQAGFGADLMLPTLAWAQLESGDLERSETSARTALLRSRQFRRLGLPEALRVKGILCTRQGRPMDASNAFAEAVSVARQIAMPYGEARALYEWGVMLVGQNELIDARQRLETAFVVFRELAARPFRERARRDLAELDWRDVARERAIG